MYYFLFRVCYQNVHHGYLPKTTIINVVCSRIQLANTIFTVCKHCVNLLVRASLTSDVTIKIHTHTLLLKYLLYLFSLESFIKLLYYINNNIRRFRLLPNSINVIPFALFSNSFLFPVLLLLFFPS